MCPLPTNAHIQRKSFTPASIAVIGASENPGKIGSQILSNIINGGYLGKVYPINPKSKVIQDLTVYPTVLEVPESIDHAVIAIPAKFVPEVLEQCGHRQIPEVTIISAGFKEIGDCGIELENQLAEIAEKHGISILGPNCLGFMNTDINLNATFSATSANPGNLILFSQSGAFGTAILDWANHVNLGFKYFVSLGNKVNVDETTLFEHWLNTFEENNENLIFAGYLEDIKEGQKFMESASKLSKKHPVVILKPGKSENTQQAISSHTGSLATKDNITEAALKQAGIIRVHGIQELFHTIQILSRQTTPRDNSVAIVTNAGGPGVVTTDLAEEYGLKMAELFDTTKLTLQNKLPSAAGVNNPIDVLGDADAQRYIDAIEAVIVDDNVDSVIVLLTPQAVTEVEKTAGAVAEIYRRYPFKPVVACFVGGETVDTGIEILNNYQMPIFEYPRQAVAALANSFRYRQALEKPVFIQKTKNKEAKNIIKLQGKNVIGKQAEDLVREYGITLPKSIYLHPNDPPPPDIEVSVGFPQVAKIIAPNLLHKTEFSAVKLGIKTRDELTAAIAELNAIWARNFQNSIPYTIQVQEQILDGENLIIGFERDPSFGPVLIFGLGGTATELFEDVSQRVVPIDKAQAKEMILEIKTSALLTGFRGSKPRDLNAIADTLVKVSSIAIDHTEILEFDINPYIVLNEDQGGFAADVKIITDKKTISGRAETN